MKKTLLVTMDYYPAIGGISEYWERLSDSMPSREWVVLAPELPVGVFEKKVNYTLYRKRFFSKLLWPRWITLIIAIAKIVKKEDIRCILVGQVLPVGSAVSFVSLFAGVPYVVSVHGMDLGMATRSFLKKGLAQMILRNARMVIANSSESARRAVLYGVSENRVSIIYPCADIQSSLNNVEKKENYPVLLTLSRLVKRKGLEYVIDALPKILREFPTCKYVIVGGGQMRRELADLVKARGLTEYVEFAGVVSEANKKNYYNTCDVFVMTPYEEKGDVEGFGIVYLEANGYGKPVIGSRSGGVSDAVVDGVTGLLVEEKDSDAIADAVLRLARDKTFAQKLGIQGYERVKREFQWPVQAAKLQKILTYL